MKVKATFESGEDKIEVDMDYEESTNKLELGIKSATGKSLGDLEEQGSPALGVAINFFKFLNGE